MEGKDPKQYTVAEKPNAPGAAFQTSTEQKQTEKYRSLKRKFKILRDVRFPLTLQGIRKYARPLRDRQQQGQNSLERKIVASLLLIAPLRFLQTKVDAILKAQKIEEEEKKQMAAIPVQPMPNPAPTGGAKHKYSEVGGMPGKRDEVSKHHVNS